MTDDNPLRVTVRAQRAYHDVAQRHLHEYEADGQPTLAGVIDDDG